ncbi:MAG: hypothetical protein AW07_00479 [Candidatus Accumulibacter sp. SK-11]|jgi:hypothetical protein|nr:MAG: hypothetical protein AW07_00479 [Candidatus Accumulibacter sp. SK-11]
MATWILLAAVLIVVPVFAGHAIAAGRGCEERE